MTREYCYHCGGELAEGAPPRITSTQVAPAEPRPGQPCRCDEIPRDTGIKLRISGPYNADQPAPDTSRLETDS